MANLALSGIASGVDTNGIVQKLTAVDQQGLQRYSVRQAQVQGRQDALNGIASKLSSLKAAAGALTSADLWKPVQTAESSDTARVGVTLLGGAGIGGHTIQVDRLASSAQLGFAFAKSGEARSFDLSYAADPASKVTVRLGANAAIEDVAAAVNGTANSPAAAVVITMAGGEKRLVLAARKTGSGGELSVDATNLADGQLTADAALTRAGAGLNAAIAVDGKAVDPPPQSNVLEHLVPGVRITLKGVTSTPASVTVSTPTANTSAIKSRLQAFVTAYNAFVTAADNELTEEPAKSPTSTFEAKRGQLFGDPGLSGMLSEIRRRVQSSIGGLGTYDSLDDIGIGLPKAGGSSSDDAKLGRLTIDNAKLDAALAGDHTQMRALFAGKDAAKGFTDLVGSFVDGHTGKSRGTLDVRVAGATSELKSLKDQVNRATSRINTRQKRLQAQFAAMESAMGKLQSQQSWLSGQIAALRRY